MLHLFNNKVQPGEIANLPSYNFYAKLSGGLEPQDPVSGVTIVLEDSGSEEIAETVIESSRSLYARKYVAKEKSETTTDKKGEDQEKSEASNSLMQESEKTAEKAKSRTKHTRESSSSKKTKV